MIPMTQIRIPRLVRIKPGALQRLGIYLDREAYNPVHVLSSPLPPAIEQTARKALADRNITVAQWIEVHDNRFEDGVRIFSELPQAVTAIVGIGGGKALDCAKYIAFLAGLPYIAVPTSLSNDGFCSPQSSLTIKNKRRSLPAALPHGVVLDVNVCLGAPKSMWLSGVGDLISKLTAVRDWKLAFHHRGEAVNDFAALLSDATVYQFMSRPNFDVHGTSLLGTALMLNGIAMEICGSSRPASGSEHLISHALDHLSARPRLHGLQVGVATYIVSRLQEGFYTAEIDGLFKATGFWDEIASDPFSKKEWLAAADAAPSIKENFFTVLSLRNCLPEIELMLNTDPVLASCFAD